jgi:ABC-type sugar transport system ATPase subunit
MIEIKNLTVDLGTFCLQDINLKIEPGEYFIVLGPTGSGKTILLESIAGLYPIKSGEIWLNGREVTKVEPEKRGIGFVYQDYALFPHLSVKGNILFGLKQMKQPKGELQSTVDLIAGLLGVSHLLERKSGALHQPPGAPSRRALERPRPSVQRGRAARASGGSPPP